MSSSDSTAPPSTSDSTAQPSAVVVNNFKSTCSPECLDFLNMPLQDRMSALQNETKKSFLQKCETECFKK